MMMQRFKDFVIRHAIALPFSIVAMVMALTLTNGGFFITMGSWGLTYWLTIVAGHYIQTGKHAKKARMSRVEYKEIQRQLDEARQKKRQLLSAYRNVKTSYSFKRLTEIQQLVGRIIQVVEKDPNKFYHVDTFFYAHLDTVVAIMTRYAELSSEPVRSDEMQITLQETRDKLLDVTQLLENDLQRARAVDLEMLNLDLDYLDVSLEKRKRLQHKGDS